MILLLNRLTQKMIGGGGNNVLTGATNCLIEVHSLSALEADPCG